ncbi:MAG: hypothetical protein LBU64_06020 [Planctomycetota bacterium]|jgi:hypothetical protein|nr:hypothetical protein [Planctomycetota bacterium]
MKPESRGKTALFRSGWPLYWGAAILFLAGAAWLAAWLTQRSLRSPARKRAVKSWLDDRLNADVSLLGAMSARINLLRPSRLVLENVEIDHPNAVFPGKFLVAGRIEALIAPWSLVGLWPDRLGVGIRDFILSVEGDETGEWSLDGLARPVGPGEGHADFPFPEPSFSSWRMELSGGLLYLRRHGRELEIPLDGELGGSAGNRGISLRLAGAGLTLRDGTESGRERRGRMESVSVLFSRALPLPLPERCDIEVSDLPLSLLHFLAAGFPLEDIPGNFTGSLRIRPFPGALALLSMEGELREAQLAAFGLPRQVPLRLSWPLGPKRDDLKAEIRLGPPGFGSFEITLPLDRTGNFKLLGLRGDVAVLDSMSDLLRLQAEWPKWLTLVFPSVEWVSSGWLGFGWSGGGMRLSLAGSAAGLRLTGEADFLGGRARLEMIPGRPEAPIGVTLENGEARQFAEAVSPWLPESFRVKVQSGGFAFNYRALPDGEGNFPDWGAGLVFSNQEIRLAESGSWWGGLAGIAKAISEALPDWGGGDGSGILRLTTQPLWLANQMSVVVNRNRDGMFGLEYRAHGEVFGQSAGYLEKSGDGDWLGEIVFFGPSRLVEETKKANPDLGGTLEELSRGSGIRTVFRVPAQGEPDFSFPFLEAARERRGASPETGIDE